jgi:hypothetical protein
MNEAIITFVSVERRDGTPYPFTSVVRVEFEGTPEALLAALNHFSGVPEGFRVVAMERMRGQAM